MQILLSPAKTMDMNPLPDMPQGFPPRFEKEARLLASGISGYSRSQLQLLLQISNKLTDLNYRRYQQFESAASPVKPAILAYTGTVFRHIRPQNFTPEDYAYAQQHICIISTLYGLLRPLDLIKAYRLTYKIKIKGIAEENLYDFWRPKLTAPLLQKVKKDDNILINLASLDIQDALDMEKLDREIRLITPEFKEYKNGKYETIRTYAKMARGEMTRYLLLKRIRQPEDIKKFQWDGFRYSAILSNEKHYVFTKKLPEK